MTVHRWGDRSGAASHAGHVLRAQGAYELVRTHGGIAVTAGMTPRANGEIVTKGRVGRDLDVATAQDAAALSARNALVAIELALGGLERIEAALQLVVYVQTSDGFTDHSRVADGASRVLLDVLGDRGRAARSAVGVLSLPGGACMELWLTVAYQATVGSAR